MNGKRVATLLIAGLMLFVVALVAVPQNASAQGPNLLQNPGFEEGHFNQDNIAEITVPNGWRMHWSNGESQIFGGYAETARPETVVWNIAGAPDHEKDVFWKDGIYTVKIFKGWAPLWAAMSQDVSGLEVGRRYRLVAPVYIDIVADYGEGGKIPPTDPRQGRVRLGASPVGAAWRDEGQIGYSGWWTAETVQPFYQAYPTFIHEFTATAPDMTVWIEMASNYPHPNNGFFIDTVGLYALDEVDTSAAAAAPAAPAAGDSGGGGGASAPAAAPQPAPEPQAEQREDGSLVHIVQSGDTWWSLAIQYAGTMGITPEEALTQIPELNGNPQWINPTQELLILPAGSAPIGDAAEEPAEEVADEAEAPAEEAEAADGESTEAVEEAEGSEVEEATTDDSAEEAASEATESQDVLANVTDGSVCVQAFYDTDGDGIRYEDEGTVPDNAITLAKDGNTVSTWISDTSADAYCFENLENGSYQVQIYPAAGYVVTNDDSWAVGVADGVMVPVSFGLQDAPTDEVASAETAADASADAAEAADSPAEEAPSDGLFSNNTGLMLLGAAGVLLLLAGVGVVLLRRG